jgi:hypothetical protein
MVTSEMLDLLDKLGTNKARGTGRTLLEHLEGTRAVLAEWGSSTDVCLAGLFHSIYGAEGGAARARDANLARRDDVRRLIGPVAEELAYFYSALERRHLFGNATRSGQYVVNDLFEKREVPVSEITLRALFEIEAANFVEGPLSRLTLPQETVALYRTLWEKARPLVSARGYEAVMARFRALDEQRGTSK